MDTVKDALEKLERDLIAKLSFHREAIVPVERELARVRLAKAAIDEPADLRQSMRWDQLLADPKLTHKNMSMKELTLKALREQFRNGATSSQLLDFFRNAWGRDDVIRSSLSPQLSRLKAEDKIDREGLRWFLVSPETKEAPKRGASDTGEGLPPSPNDGRKGLKDLLG